MKYLKISTLCLVCGMVLMLGLSGQVAALERFALIIKDHVFHPDTIKVASGKKFSLVIENRDASAEEFESHDLNREKKILPGRKVILKLGPLSAGRYHFYGEFHPNTAKGTIIVE